MGSALTTRNGIAWILLGRNDWWKVGTLGKPLGWRFNYLKHGGLINNISWTDLQTCGFKHENMWFNRQRMGNSPLAIGSLETFRMELTTKNKIKRVGAVRWLRDLLCQHSVGISSNMGRSLRNRTFHVDMRSTGDWSIKSRSSPSKPTAQQIR